MKRFAIVALAAVAVVTFGGSLGDTQQSSHLFAGLQTLHLKAGTSTNWSGYASATNLTNPQYNSVSNVSGEWTIPAVACQPGNQYSAIWVGIDGYNDNTVEQTGTGQDCHGSTASYYAWYEMYPHYMYRANLDVSPGDDMVASVQYTSRNNYNLQLTDNTTGQSFNTTQHLIARRTSAEWVVEAPSSYGGVLPLANYGSVAITNANTTINGHTGGISDSAWKFDKITMQSGSTVKALPSDLTSGGSSFTDVWKHL